MASTIILLMIFQSVSLYLASTLNQLWPHSSISSCTQDILTSISCFYFKLNVIKTASSSLLNCLPCSHSISVSIVANLLASQISIIYNHLFSLHFLYLVCQIWFFLTFRIGRFCFMPQLHQLSSSLEVSSLTNPQL